MELSITCIPISSKARNEVHSIVTGKVGKSNHTLRNILQKEKREAHFLEI